MALTVKYVYVIVGRDMKKEDVIKDLRAERYDVDYYKFFFGQDVDKQFKVESIEFADEVWCFGKCGEVEDYRMALELRADIWVMG